MISAVPMLVSSARTNLTNRVGCQRVREASDNHSHPFCADIRLRDHRYDRRPPWQVPHQSERRQAMPVWPHGAAGRCDLRSAEFAARCRAAESVREYNREIEAVRFGRFEDLDPPPAALQTPLNEVRSRGQRRSAACTNADRGDRRRFSWRLTRPFRLFTM